MHVWIVEPTAYDMYGIDGVYDSLEAAKASRSDVRAWEERDGEWWTPGDCAMDQAGAHIYEVEVGTLGVNLGCVGPDTPSSETPETTPDIPK